MFSDADGVNDEWEGGEETESERGECGEGSGAYHQADILLI